jgi:hypothetical protein
MNRALKWTLIGGALCAAAGVGLLIWTGGFKRQLDEQARRQVIQYLEERFESRVEFRSIQIHLPKLSSLALFFKRGRGALASIDGYDLNVYRRGESAPTPMFKLPHFRFDIDLGLLAGPVKTVTRLETEGMEINVPPEGRRIQASGAAGQGERHFKVIIKDISMSKVTLRLLPRDTAKRPLTFDIDQLAMEDAGPDTAMRYQARLTNPRPPGLIHSAGTFGPWNASEPGDTPVAGVYQFDKADLSVFEGIRGFLDSKGKFQGTLDNLAVTGEATVADIALKSSGNKVPLSTQFQAQVDGTNGDTVLQPVKARLGRTSFVTSGAILKHEELGKRSIFLTVKMPRGDMRDILRLAVKGTPFMQGTLRLNARIGIPPLSGKVRDKLMLDGNFAVANGAFRRDAIQDKVDELSRRGQGQPKNPAIDDVVSNVSGQFHMRGGEIRMSRLSFDVPGASVALDGVYDLPSETIDFHGQLRLRAKVSQTLTGWKRWLAKPVDPFFAKQGAGTLLDIKVSGTASHPEFGLDRHKGGSRNKAAPTPAAKQRGGRRVAEVR